MVWFCLIISIVMFLLVVLLFSFCLWLFILVELVFVLICCLLVICGSFFLCLFIFICLLVCCLCCVVWFLITIWWWCVMWCCLFWVLWFCLLYFVIMLGFAGGLLIVLYYKWCLRVLWFSCLTLSFLSYTFVACYSLLLFYCCSFGLVCLLFIVLFVVVWIFAIVDVLLFAFDCSVIVWLDVVLLLGCFWIVVYWIVDELLGLWFDNSVA